MNYSIFFPNRDDVSESTRIEPFRLLGRKVSTQGFDSTTSSVFRQTAAENQYRPMHCQNPP